MKSASRLSLLFAIFVLSLPRLAAEPLPLKRVIELALSHSTTAALATADEQRAFASYREAHNQYLPQFVLGSGLGKSWGFPLSLEGSAPAIVNLNAQSALINPALRDFVRAAKTEWQASSLRGKDQRNQVIQDTVLSYVELGKWEALLGHLLQQLDDAVKMEKVVDERIQEGVDNPMARNQARLTTARARLHISEARGAADILRSRLAQFTGLPPSSIETVPDSVPALPAVKQEDDLATKAVQASPSVEAAEGHVAAEVLRARGEHRAMLPSVDFASQYALLATYNNYDLFFKTFQRHNATLGVAIRFPFFSPTQRARAEGADADVSRARKNADAAKNQLSEETLRLQRSVGQLAAEQQVADLEYQIAQSNLGALQVRLEAGTATVHDLEDARVQTTERFNQLQDANFELERAQVTLLRATGDLEAWAGVGK
jgi:outer membrane protein